MTASDLAAAAERRRGPIRRFWVEVRGYPFHVFLICLAGYTLARTDEALFSYVIPSILRDFGISLKAIGWVLSASFALSSVGVLAIGMLTDVLGRKKMFQSTLVGTAIFVTLHALAPNIVVLTLLRGLGFTFSNAMSPVKTIIVTEVSPARYRGVLTGFLQAGYPLGWFFASLIASLVLDRLQLSWRWVFVPAILAAPAAFIFGRYLKETARFERSRAEQRGSDAKPQAWYRRLAELFQPRYRRVTIVGFLASFMFGGAYGGSAFYFPTYFETVKQITPEQAKLIVGIGFGIGALGYVAAAIVGEFYLTRRNTFVIWVLLGTIALVGLIWWSRTFAEIFLCYTLMTVFVYGAITVLGTLVAESFPTRVRTTGAAFTASTGIQLGLAIFPALVSKAIQDWLGWQWALTLLVAGSFFVAALLFLLLPRVKSGLEVEEIAG
ncbi:MAG: MFS transporter [Acidobacteria bacterium]|nr:MFS transporter [Acidobacteriota bacterium]